MSQSIEQPVTMPPNGYAPCDPLAAEALMRHVRALADDIGPRPTGHAEEALARGYIRSILSSLGFTDIEEQPFATPDTPGYAMVLPQALGAISNAIAPTQRWGRLVGGLLALFGAYSYWRFSRMQRSPLLEPLPAIPLYPSANTIVRIPATGERRQRVVLIGHTDTQKYRTIMEPQRKQMFPPWCATALLTLVANGLAQLAQAAGVNQPARLVQRLSLGMLTFSVLATAASEGSSYVDGANDNATAVACLLGLGAHLRQHPLQHTEVWLAFTGAEEIGGEGMHVLLDRYGEELRDAWFIDFEMVGSDEIAYITRHSGMSLGSAYTPDAESLQLAAQTAQAHPDLNIQQREMVIMEEVGVLRGRGYRGICLAGVGPDGWLENWHTYADVSANVKPGGIERAARFALAMLHQIDSEV